MAAARDWQPFRAAAHSGAALMLAHVVLPGIDTAYPASLSKAVVQGLLRKERDYQGLLPTDDLNMGAAYRLGIGHAAVAALDAGVDMLLISCDPDQYYRAMQASAGALRRGIPDPVQLAASRQRIAAAAGVLVHPARMTAASRR